MFRLGLSSLFIVAAALACACAKVGQVSDDGAPEPPRAWVEFDTMPGAAGQPEADGDGQVDAEIFEGKIIGIAYGPSRSKEAADISEEMAILNVKVLDSWSVSSETWDGLLNGVCVDRVVHYNPESKTHAEQLAGAWPGGRALAEDRTEAHYDLIVQLCPVDLQ